MSGWKALESLLCALKYIIKGSGDALLQQKWTKEGGDKAVSEILNKCIGRGMGDNWCQVRNAASIAVRSFLMKLQEQGREAYLPILALRMCLNRYYIADRVQKYSQESWRMIGGNQGRELVARYANEIVDYCVEMTNHLCP